MILCRLDSCVLFFNEKARRIFKYIGSGILITAGFIDMGNWAANMVAGADYEYDLLRWLHHQQLC
jgi:Mn2+/Fe2+ NRAMP family transporter